MSERYDSAPHLRSLTNFQLRSVDHVVTQLYGPAKADRFLVADETGLGKTRVAQGVIARAIEILQDVDSVKRIDIVYVCSNADLARQNIGRLNVTGQRAIPFSSRLTMLGAHTRQLNRASEGGKPVNLVSFTPGTSFESGSSLGMARERAMIALALGQLLELGTAETTATYRLLQGGVQKLDTFRWTVSSLAQEVGEDGIDPAILEAFDARLRVSGSDKDTLLARLRQLIDGVGRKQSVPQELHGQQVSVVRAMRAELARASVQTLEPDLVILDEFQRFRHLLDPGNPAGELAHHLFEHEAAKVLLLSATPYKPFTYAEEGDDDHARDLFRTLRFLAKGRSDVDVDAIRSMLREYRDVVTRAENSEPVTMALRGEIMKLMSRAERPTLEGHLMSSERRRTADEVTADDLVGYAALQKVSALVRRERDHGLLTPEYWKSAPYFVNFSDTYQLGRRIREHSVTPSGEVSVALAATQRLVGADLEQFRLLDPGNARLRALVRDTLDQGWWRLLWMPPSLPYVQPAGPYADPEIAGITKRLVFSSWAATPAAVAGVLSYEAERRAAEDSDTYTAYTAENRARLARHLQYNLAAGRPASMSTLLLHWPLAGLARVANPLQAPGQASGSLPTVDQLRQRVRSAVNELIGVSARSGADRGSSSGSATTDRYWRAAFALSSSWPANEFSDSQFARPMTGTTVSEDGETEPQDNGALQAHIGLAREARDADSAGLDPETVDTLTDVALFSPANISYRVLARLGAGDDASTEDGLFDAAATLANGLRSLFNRPDVIQIVDRSEVATTTSATSSGEAPYWRKVLAYCAAGNLEATLDEYVDHLLHDLTGDQIDDDALIKVATLAAAAMSLRAARYQALDPTDSSKNLSFSLRFALRYGGRQATGDDARLPEVRAAFNSPFWPFVLASTSVGQEGIDFHWWCHAVFHWNVPANPVDFEQREGRVDRYRGHAVRKNVAQRHGDAVLSAGLAGSPWPRLWSMATDFHDRYGDFTPSWVYPGDATIERHLAPMIMSSDERKYDQIKKDVALYRLTFGQPRQEDMLELLRRRGLDDDQEARDEMRINLAP